jgi:hypothetical protein
MSQEPIQKADRDLIPKTTETDEIKQPMTPEEVDPEQKRKQKEIGSPQFCVGALRAPTQKQGFQASL